MKLRLIEGWRQWWRFASVWASGVGFSVLTVWAIMPPAVRDAVPDLIELMIGAVLFGGVLLARITDQPKLKGKISGEE